MSFFGAAPRTGADLSHRQLRRHLRHPADGGPSIYSPKACFSGMVGRLSLPAGDCFGAARVLTLAPLAQAVVALGYAVAREPGSFYTVAGSLVSPTRA